MTASFAYLLCVFVVRILIRRPQALSGGRGRTRGLSAASTQDDVIGPIKTRSFRNLFSVAFVESSGSLSRIQPASPQQREKLISIYSGDLSPAPKKRFCSFEELYPVGPESVLGGSLMAAVDRCHSDLHLRAPAPPHL